MHPIIRHELGSGGGDAHRHWLVDLLDSAQIVVSLPSCLEKLGYALMILAVLAATGAHWTVLQSLAWTSMLTNNLSSCSFTEAVQKTFDGKHPCKLCQIIEHGKKTEKKRTLVKVETKLDFWLTPARVVLDTPLPLVFSRCLTEVPRPRVDSPPTPPPRLAAA